MNSGTTSLPCSTASSSAGLSLSRRSTSLNHITTTFEFGPLARAVAGTVDGAVDGAEGANGAGAPSMSGDKMEVDDANEAVEQADKADDFEGEATFDTPPATVSEQAQHLYDQMAITLVGAVMLELYDHLHLDELAKGSHTSAEQKVKESVPDEVKVRADFENNMTLGTTGLHHICICITSTLMWDRCFMIHL